jgi:hypothetical protein
VGSVHCRSERAIEFKLRPALNVVERLYRQLVASDKLAQQAGTADSCQKALGNLLLETFD